ncbi:MAG: response regulator transcription factor [Treponema sp.]|jgi:DNA-binding NarL/FixJ family response regulator|nr:response regulator transcription factor [Treponema sp.]
MSEPKLKILLADDQRVFAESLCTFLSNYAEDMTVIGIALNGKEAVSMTCEYHPDIILMDVRMPEMDGVEAVRIIKQKEPEIKIIMLSTYHEDEFVRTSLLAGSSGYLLKDISPTELITAIRALQNNIIQISPEIARSMVQQRYTGQDKNKDSKTIPGSESLPWLKTLTNREREIFTFLATGYDNEQIARTLNLAIQTVKNQVSIIYSKLGVKDRFEIIRLANRR